MAIQGRSRSHTVTYASATLPIGQGSINADSACPTSAPAVRATNGSPRTVPARTIGPPGYLLREHTGNAVGLGSGPACRERCTRPHATLTRNARRHLRQVVGEAFRGLAAGGRDRDRAPPCSGLSGARRLSRRAVYRRCVDRRRAGVAREHLRLHAARADAPEVQEV